MGARSARWFTGETAAHPRAPRERSREGRRGSPRQDGGVVEMTPERFEELVAEALDSIPPALTDLIDNCVVLVAEEPPADDPDLLGLYDGTPLTERDSSYSLVVPDRITLFRGPLLEMCEDEEEVVREVRITVVHEIAHHFGIEDRKSTRLNSSHANISYAVLC